MVRVDGKAVKIFPALRRFGLRVPLGERAVQVARNGAAHLDNLDAVVVVGVKQMSGELLPAAARIAFRDRYAKA